MKARALLALLPPLAAAAMAIGAGAVLVLAATLPSLDDLRRAHPASHLVALDAKGREVERLRVDFTKEREPWLPISRVPPAVIRSVLAQEDRRYLWHPGVDPVALASAARAGLAGAKPRGASTVAMQVARLALPSLRARGALARKPLEILYGVALTMRWGRGGVLEAWTNLVPMPGAHVGLPSAARGLLRAELVDLDMREASRLVAWARRPAAGAATLLESRRVAWHLPPGPPDEPPHLLTSLLAGRLEDATGAFARARDGGGGRLATTIDARLQEEIRTLARDELARLAARNVTGIAAVVLDNASGAVLAYVGNATPLGGEEPSWIDAASSRRQAGSTLKPFLYALAFARGLARPDTALLDTPYESVRDGASWRPGNYDGRHHGAVPARIALASSLNIPALRVLDLVGAGPFMATLERLGFHVPDAPEVLGGSVALGTLDVTLVELAAAYATLARGGTRVVPRFFEGAPIDALPPERVFPESAARAVTAILSSTADREPAFGAHSALATSIGAAVKTGTSVDMRDNWCVGFTDTHTVAVWAGNEVGEPMWDVSGVEGAAPLWHDVVERLVTLHGDRGPVADAGEPPSAASGREGIVAESPPEPILARIVAPMEGSTYARDAGIPDDRHRMVFVAQGNIGKLAWAVDGVRVARTAEPFPWAPHRGTHTLALVDEGGREVHRVTFKVK